MFEKQSKFKVVSANIFLLTRLNARLIAANAGE